MSHPIVEPTPGSGAPLSPYPLLFATYSTLIVYGVSSAYFGIGTIGQVSGDVWAVLWPILVAAFSLLALIATLRSRSLERFGFEVATTIALGSLLIGGYPVAIIARSFEDGDWSRVPYALLPIIISYPIASRLSVTVRGIKR
jgi:hypothetical protein